MAIDFSATVLAQCMATFARAVIIDPIKSQPGAQPYKAEGILASRTLQNVLADGAVVSDVTTTLGIRLADENPDGTPMFVRLPRRGDKITFLDLNSQPLVDGLFWVADSNADGQGGYTLVLRRDAP